MNSSLNKIYVISIPDKALAVAFCKLSECLNQLMMIVQEDQNPEFSRDKAVVALMTGRQMELHHDDCSLYIYSCPLLEGNNFIEDYVTNKAIS